MGDGRPGPGSATDYEHGNVPVEFGALPLRSVGDPIKHPMHGLGGLPVNNLFGAEEPDDHGLKALNYRTEPLWARRGNDRGMDFGGRNEMDYSRVFSSTRLPDGRCAAGIPPSDRAPTPCDPETPVQTAGPGETVRLHVVHPGGHTRQQGLAVGGHGWNPTPWLGDSLVFDAGRRTSLHQGVFNAFGPMMGITLQLEVGGAAHVSMDYLVRSQASFLLDNWLWGLPRVGRPEGDPGREAHR